LFAAVDSQTLTSKVYWVNQMGEIPFVGMNSDGCAFTTCPIQADRRQAYEYQLSISKKFPVVSRNGVCPCNGVCTFSNKLPAYVCICSAVDGALNNMSEGLGFDSR
jgi:hypothetical protein